MTRLRDPQPRRRDLRSAGRRRERRHDHRGPQSLLQHARAAKVHQGRADRVRAHLSEMFLRTRAAASANSRSSCCTTADVRSICRRRREEERLLAAWPDEFHEQRLPIDVARCGDAPARHHRPARAGPADREVPVPLPQRPADPRQVHPARPARSLSRPDRARPASRGHPAASKCRPAMWT